MKDVLCEGCTRESIQSLYSQDTYFESTKDFQLLEGNQDNQQKKTSVFEDLQTSCYKVVVSKSL